MLFILYYYIIWFFAGSVLLFLFIRYAVLKATGRNTPVPETIHLTGMAISGILILVCAYEVLRMPVTNYERHFGVATDILELVDMYFFIIALWLFYQGKRTTVTGWLVAGCVFLMIPELIENVHHWMVMREYYRLRG